MALNDEELNERRQRREELARKRARDQRRLYIALIAAAVILVGCAVGIFILARRSGQGSGLSGQETAPAATMAKEEAKPDNAPVRFGHEPTTTIHIRAAGDLNVTTSVVESGLAATGYEYTRAFMDVMSTLSEADLTVINLEGNICGEPYGSERTSAPNQLLESLRSAGVDLIQMANSCTINNGLIGLSTTLQAIRNAGMEPLGAYATPEDFRASKGYTICEAQGIRIAFVSFTKGVGGMGLPAGSEDCVNLLYEDYASTYDKIDRDGIRRVLRSAAEEKPDITIALLHWGSEYNDVISDTQEAIVSLMKKEGVDVIIGSHPHLVQQIDYNQAAGTLVAYSLGDFFGNGDRGGSNYSIILDVEITRDNTSGTTRVTGFDYIPIYTLTEEQCDGFRRVVRIREAVKVYQDNYVDKVTKACYEDMQYSLERIESRVSGKG